MLVQRVLTLHQCLNKYNQHNIYKQIKMLNEYLKDLIICDLGQ